jgi:uncharacterized membrane protein HdeD (DUF308 family)
MTAVVAEVEVLPAPAPPRWLQITTGVLWVLVSLVVLSADTAAVVTVAYLVAFVLIFAGVDELVLTAVAPGWRWLHAVLGALFVIGGIAALFEPFQTFGYLALLIGWFLVLKGAFDLAMSIAFRHVLPLWGLLLALGIGEILLGLWAIGYPGRSAWLVLVWVGVGAMFRGIGDLVAGFTRGGAR